MSMCTRSCAVCITIFSNGSIIPTGFKFTELHALTLAIVLMQSCLRLENSVCVCVCVCNVCVTYHVASNQVGCIGSLAMVVRGVVDDLLPG